MTTKIAVSLPDHLVAEANEAVAEGRADSVSAYVAGAMLAYSRRDSLAALLDDLDDEYGSPDHDTAAWAPQALRLDVI